MTEAIIREARTADWPRIVALLEAIQLPTSDLTSARPRFWVAEAIVAAQDSPAAHDRLAVAGLETSQDAARGYEPTTRDRVPDAVKASAEFRSLCPASATVMAKSL